MNLFYQPDIEPSATQLIFDKEESRHIGKVLRKKEGDVLHVTNGTGVLFTTTLLSTNPKQCIAQVDASEIFKPLPYNLHLAVAPTKLNERYEWFLEKATEIGITQITPILCDHSERKVIKEERYEKIIVSAMKQSLKMHKPVLNPAVSFKDFIRNNTETTKYIAHCEEGKDKRSLKSMAIPGKDYLILIGPEGDFSNYEIKAAKEQGFIAVSLGESRLRTETAAIVACHSIAYSNES